MTMSKEIRALGAASALASLLLGCSAASNTFEGVTARRAPAGPSVNERVIMGSPALGRKLTYGEVVARREGLLLHVQVALENQTKDTVSFEYRWEWTDADGFELGDTLSSWQPGVINGKEHKLMTGVGPGPAAANFRLYIRKPGS